MVVIGNQDNSEIDYATKFCSKCNKLPGNNIIQMDQTHWLHRPCFQEIANKQLAEAYMITGEVTCTQCNEGKAIGTHSGQYYQTLYGRVKYILPFSALALLYLTKVESPLLKVGTIFTTILFIPGKKTFLVSSALLITSIVIPFPDLNPIITLLMGFAFSCMHSVKEAIAHDIVQGQHGINISKHELMLGIEVKLTDQQLFEIFFDQIQPESLCVTKGQLLNALQNSIQPDDIVINEAKEFPCHVFLYQEKREALLNQLLTHAKNANCIKNDATVSYDHNLPMKTISRIALQGC